MWYNKDGLEVFAGASGGLEGFSSETSEGVSSEGLEGFCSGVSEGTSSGGLEGFWSEAVMVFSLC